MIRSPSDCGLNTDDRKTGFTRGDDSDVKKVSSLTVNGFDFVCFGKKNCDYTVCWEGLIKNLKRTEVGPLQGGLACFSDPKTH